MLAAAILLLSGCSASRIRTSADREVYGILDEKSKEVTAEKIPWQIKSDEKAKPPREALLLTVKDALVIAAENSYDYQRRKEDVYLQALSLTSQRYQWRLRYGLGGKVSWVNNDEGENVGANVNLNLVKWLAQGAKITFNIKEDFLNYLSGDREEAFQSIVSLNVLQPLFRGAGRKIAQEDLFQAERRMVYQIRSFLRYQQGFSVDVARRHFALLRSKNNLQNYENNYLYLKETTERIQMLSEAGEIAPFQADQARQNEYQAYQQWLEASNSYQSSLDEFKIFMGLPLETELSLDEKELQHFLQEGVPEITLDPEQSTVVALEKRLDLMTTYDEVEDSERKVDLALDQLRTKLDLNLNVESRSAERSSPTFDLADTSYRAGVDIDLPVDKIPERNTYREALITLERKKRDLTLKKDQVKLEILNSYRDLQEAYETYVIQNKSLKLAKDRVESTELLLKAGRATTRDLLESQESLLNAENSLSSSIVKYWISYLEFLQDTESLELDERGVWKGALYETTPAQDQ